MPALSVCHANEFPAFLIFETTIWHKTCLSPEDLELYVIYIGKGTNFGMT